VQGGWSPELWEGQVGQVAGGSLAEQWCKIACVGWSGEGGGRVRNTVPNLIHTHKTHTKR